MISCPFCGAHSNLTIEIPVTGTKAWTHYCPVCKKPWKVKVWVRRGRTELNVEPDVALAVKETAKTKAKPSPKAKATPKAKPKPKSKKKG